MSAEPIQPPIPAAVPSAGPAPDAGIAKDAGGAERRGLSLIAALRHAACPGGSHHEPRSLRLSHLRSRTLERRRTEAADGLRRRSVRSIDCPMLACTGGLPMPNPDPLRLSHSARRAPDAGVAKDAGRADTPPVCPPIACPAIACVGGTHPNPDPCGCPLCGPAPDAGVAKDAAPPTACPMLASLNSTDAAQVGYTAARVLLECTVRGGATEDLRQQRRHGLPWTRHDRCGTRSAAATYVRRTSTA